MDANYSFGNGRFDIIVSIHAPVMDANNGKLLYFLTTCGFNPRARDGREDIISKKTLTVEVSIHAPVMDANIQAFEVYVNH